MRIGKKRIGNIAEKSDSSHQIIYKEKNISNEGSLQAKGFLQAEGSLQAKGSFASLLEIEKAEQAKEVKSRNLSRFISSLDFLGEQLKKRPSIENYSKYRNQMKKILDLAVPGTFGIEKTFSRPNVRNPKTREFHLLNIVDKEMESLLKMIKDKEKDRLLLASKVVKIKGLIIDLLR